MLCSNRESAVMDLFAYTERDKGHRVHEWFNDPDSATVMRSRCGYGVVYSVAGLRFDTHGRTICKICGRFNPALTQTVGEKP